MIILLGLLACAAIDPSAPRALPEPLPERPFLMPTSQEATLSNGLRVRVVPNHEVPLFELSLTFETGSFADPPGKEGLNSVAFDLMNDGSAGRDGATITRRLKQLGGSVSSWGGGDSSGISVSGLRRNLDPLLDLWRDALLHPDFPESEWTLLRDRRVANLKADAEKPNAIAAKVTSYVLWGDTYDGRTPVEASLTAISTSDLRAWHAEHVIPTRAILLAGGDVELADLVPRLEARLATWTTTTAPPPLDPAAHPREPQAAAIYLVDKPGAAQSVLSAALPADRPTDPDHWPLYMGNTVLGGAFTARMNMNLREDKGYTYGARCGLNMTLGPDIWSCSASVATGVTAPALVEMRKEIEDVLTTRPVTADELDFFRSYRINSFYNGYETADELLGELVNIWRYQLPEDWLERYVAGVKAVDAPSANAALQRYLRADRIAYVVVGDAEKIAAELSTVGLPIVRLDRQGHKIEEAR